MAYVQDADSGTLSHHLAGVSPLQIDLGESRPPQDWGAGLNTFTHAEENVRSAFANASIGNVPALPEQGDSVSVGVTLCQTENDFVSNVSTAFDAAAVYSGVPLSAAVSYVQDSKFTAASTIVLAQASVCLGRQGPDLRTLVLTDEASRLMTSDPAGFVAMYGNYFHSGYLLGGKMTILMCFSSRDLETKQALDSQLAVALNEQTKVGAKVTAAFSAKSSASSLDVRVFHAGGNPPKASALGPNADPSALVDYALGFEHSVDAQHAVPYSSFYEDFGSVGDAGPAFRVALVGPSRILDALTDELVAYATLRRRCALAISNAGETGLTASAAAQVSSIANQISSDLTSLQDYLRTTSRADHLLPIDTLIGTTLKQRAAVYATQLDAAFTPVGIPSGAPLWMHLVTQAKFVAAAESAPTVYYAKLNGSNPVRLKLAVSSEKKGPLQHGDVVYVESTESLASGYGPRMRVLGGLYGNYVGWAEENPQMPVLRLKVLKCQPTLDPTINYGDRLWLETEDGASHLEQSGPSYPDNLGVRNIVGRPGQQWTLQKPPER